MGFYNLPFIGFWYWGRHLAFLFNATDGLIEDFETDGCRTTIMAFLIIF